jgi:hypothetical protein
MVKSKRTKGQTTIYKTLYIKLNTNYDQQNTIQNTKDLTILTSTKTLGVLRQGVMVRISYYICSTPTNTILFLKSKINLITGI